MQDLDAKFLENYEEGHEYFRVKSYKHYFLGSIIISEHYTHKFLIDGQQRLTSLTLLLIFLNNLQKQRSSGPKVNLDPLIFSDNFGDKSFNINVAERTACFQALFKNQHVESEGQPEAVRNIISRYKDIEDNVPASLQNGAYIHFMYLLFIDWYLIEMTCVLE